MFQQFVGDLVALKKSTLDGEQTVGLDRLLVGYRLRVKAKPNPDSGKKSSDWYLYPREGTACPPEKGPYFRTLPEVRAHFSAVAASEPLERLCVTEADAERLEIFREIKNAVKGDSRYGSFDPVAWQRLLHRSALDPESVSEEELRRALEELLEFSGQMILHYKELKLQLKLQLKENAELQAAQSRTPPRAVARDGIADSIARTSTAAQSPRRTPPRAAATAARSGIAESLAWIETSTVAERAADLENDANAARPLVPKKPCPSCRKLTTQPRTRVFFGECPVCYEGNEELYTTSCGHPVCKACWDRM